jgi:hypothetical protein
VQIRSGRFTPGEDALIVRNWRAFAADHSLTDADALEYLQHQGVLSDVLKRAYFVPRLCVGLTLRTGYQVVKRATKLLVCVDEHSGPRYWTADEDQAILEHIEKFGTRNWYA